MTSALVPTTWAALMEMSEVIAGARGLIPRHIESPAHAAVLIMRGAELGLQPMESLGGLHLIDGKVTLGVDIMLRVAIQGGVTVAYPDFGQDLVTVELRRPNFEPFRCSWSLDDAKRAGLAGRQNWRKYPRAMLRARAVAEALRAYAPDLLAGAYLPDELDQPPQSAQAAPERAEDIIDADIVEPPPQAPQEPPASREGGAIGDREHLDALFGEQLERAIASKTLAGGPAEQVREWLDLDRESTMSDLHASAWALIMPRTIDEAQARKMARRLGTDDGQAGLRRQIYQKLGPIVERMRESPQPLEA